MGFFQNKEGCLVLYEMSKKGSFCGHMTNREKCEVIDRFRCRLFGA